MEDMQQPPQESENGAREKIFAFFRPPRLDRRGWALLAGLALLVWLSTGFYKVQPDEQGVVLRFGAWVDTTPPGLHFHLPWPIETALFPQITQIRQMQLGLADNGAIGGAREKQMLTGDENIVEADASLLWQVKDAGQYLFKVSDPETALRIAAESALREIVGRTPIQAVLSDKRREVADQTQDLLQRVLDREGAGIRIVQVQLSRVDPPSTVIDAFNDVQRARADQERARNEAEAYANDVLPRARGEAERVKQDAEAYKAQTINLAQGEAQSFTAIYQSYAQARDVTAWRLYLDAVDVLLRKSSRVILDSSGRGAGPLAPYLPLSEVKPAAAPVPLPALPAGGGK
ncbi:FtsH protease activity modulator HflK [Rhodoblastus sp.]|uniref:FtsH protease activity modulator HflK n=1 Tax=Rhodoblastus sp. TaxID=1962975 RepID=UPI0035B37E1D